MEKIRAILKNIVNQYDRSLTDPTVKPYKIIGAGNYAVVFDYGNAVLKLSTEGECFEVINNAQIINYLAKLGVNAPETYLVEIVDVGTDADNILDVLYRTIEKDEQDFSTIRKIVDGKVVFSYGDDFIYCIFQEKVEGINIFKQDWSLEEYLEYYNSIPVEHYEKFILDAHKILKEDLIIDNINKSNFIYNKDKGFYFIDLGNLEGFYNDVFNEVDSPYACTINNIIEDIPNFSRIYNKDLFRSALDLYYKLYNVLKSIYVSHAKDEKFKKQTYEMLALFSRKLAGIQYDIRNNLPNDKERLEKFKQVSKEFDEFLLKGTFPCEIEIINELE